MWLKGLLTGIVSVDVETDDFFKVDFGFENKIMSDFKIVTKCDTAYV